MFRGFGPEHQVFMESLILAQDERWRRALHMQVERESPFGGEYSGERVSNTWAICPALRDKPWKRGLIPDTITGRMVWWWKAPAVQDEPKSD